MRLVDRAPATFAPDPRLVWDELEARGYGPHGQPHDFRSRCPGPVHDGGANASSLHVSTGADGVILLHCFAHDCPAEEIVEALGLRMADLFPADGHYDARLRSARREDFTGDRLTAVNIMHAADLLGDPGLIEIKLRECPCCESPHVSIVFPGTGEPFTHCPRGCGVEAMTGGLAERVRDRGGAA